MEVPASPSAHLLGHDDQSPADGNTISNQPSHPGSQQDRVQAEGSAQPSAQFRQPDNTHSPVTAQCYKLSSTQQHEQLRKEATDSVVHSAAHPATAAASPARLANTAATSTDFNSLLPVNTATPVADTQNTASAVARAVNTSAAEPIGHNAA